LFPKQHESTINLTNIDACKQLAPQSKVYYSSTSLLNLSSSEAYKLGTKRYMKSSSQKAACVFIPTLAVEISDALKLIGRKKIQFAVSSGGHASNQGFSSTTGVQISMKGFQNVKLSGDKSYVDVGAGNIWDNVYQVLEGRSDWKLSHRIESSHITCRNGRQCRRR
jgi:FAD/FMN-containing dehydrogenase